MEPTYYIGLDVPKRIISWCLKDGGGAIHAEGTILATRLDLDHWMKPPPQPCLLLRTLIRAVKRECHSTKVAM
jgi:hypothetical protein